MGRHPIHSRLPRPVRNLQWLPAEATTERLVGRVVNDEPEGFAEERHVLTAVAPEPQLVRQCREHLLHEGNRRLESSRWIISHLSIPPVRPQKVIWLGMVHSVWIMACGRELARHWAPPLPELSGGPPQLVASALKSTLGCSHRLLYDFARQLQGLWQTGKSRPALAVYKLAVTESIDMTCRLGGVLVAKPEPKRSGIQSKLLHPGLNQLG